MATELPEGEQHDDEDAQGAPDPLGVDRDAVPLLPPHKRQIPPAPHDLSAAPGTPQEWADPVDTAPGLEFAPPAPGLAEGAYEVPAPADLDAVPPAPADDGTLPPWAEAGAPAAGSLSQSDDERAAWPTVDPVADDSAAPAAAAYESAPTPPPAQEMPLAEPPAAPAPPPPAEPAPETPAPQLEEVATAGAIVRPPEEAATREDMYDVPLGTLVYRSGLLSAEQIETALAESERIGKRLGEILVDNAMIDERDLGRLLAGQKGLPFIDLAPMQIDPDATQLLPAASARIYCALPIAIDNGKPVVAVSDPTNGLVVEGVRRAMGGDLSFTVATRSDLQKAIAEHYGGDPTVTAAETEPDAAAVPQQAAAAAYDPQPVSAPAHDPAPIEIPMDTEPAPSVEYDLAAPAAEVPVPPLATPDLSEDPHAMSQFDLAQAPILSADSPAAPLAAPTPLHTSGDTPPAVEKIVRVKVRLSDGDLVESGNFTDIDAAMAHSRELIQSFSAANATEWPYLGGRFLRPETVVSIDLIEELPATKRRERGAAARRT